MVPMDETLAYVAIDLVKRQYSRMDIKLERTSIEGIPREDLEHFCRSLLQGLNACTHMVVEYGHNDHHKVEAALKDQGLGLGDVVMMRVFLVAPPGQRMDFAGMMKAYREFFGTAAQPNKPARSTMQVGGLVDPGWLVEIEVTAAK